MANKAPSLLDHIYFCTTNLGFKLGDGVTPVDDLPIISGPPGPQGKDGLQGPAGIVLDPDDSRVIQHNQQVGEIVIFYGDSAPVGTLLCDGTTLDFDDYSELGAFLVEQNPSLDVGDGQHFMLPDMRDMFLRSTGLDRVAGSRQGDAARNVTGYVTWGASFETWPDVPNNPFYNIGNIGRYVPPRQSHPNFVFGDTIMDLSTIGESYPIAAENRPVNIAVSFAIRYETSLLCSTQASGGGSLELPPHDGRTYSMRNGEWIPNALLSDD